MAESVEAIAGAVANAIRQSLSPDTPGAAANTSVFRRSTSNQEPVPVARSGTYRPLGASTSSSTTYEVARDIRIRKRPKFSPPSLFENMRSRRSKRPGQPAKVINYVRDVVLLPNEFRARNGEISVPRASRRSKLGQAGLVGKIEIDSDMTGEQVRVEVCLVFSSPMGLLESDVKNGDLFPFSYLQRTGAGAKSLCLPAVKDSFEWTGKKVASLAKSGCYIYLLAERELPGWQEMVNVIS